MVSATGPLPSFTAFCREIPGQIPRVYLFGLQKSSFADRTLKLYTLNNSIPLDFCAEFQSYRLSGLVVSFDRPTNDLGNKSTGPGVLPPATKVTSQKCLGKFNERRQGLVLFILRSRHSRHNLYKFSRSWPFWFPLQDPCRLLRLFAERSPAKAPGLPFWLAKIQFCRYDFETLDA